MKDKPNAGGCLKTGLIGGVILAGLLILFFLTLGISGRVGLRRTYAEFLPPGKLVAVDGVQIHIHCLGSGAPTVVIDAGNGSYSLEWTPIQERLSRSVRVCTFDRPGYGWSEPGPQPRDGAQVVKELHALLATAGETGPYVLVGHSLGGVHVRLFAAQYPQEVAGMVLVDTAFPLEITPEFEAQMQSSIGFYQVMHLLSGSGVLRILGPLGGEGALPETARKLPAGLQDAYVNLLLDPKHYRTAMDEMGQLPQTFRQTSDALASKPLDRQPLGDLPLIVLTAGQMAAAGTTPFDEQRVPVAAQQIEAQLTLAKTSAHGEQRVLPDSGHSVHLDAPDAVVQAVLDVVASSRRAQ